MSVYQSITEEAHYRAGHEWSRLMRRWQGHGHTLDDDAAERLAEAALMIRDAPSDPLTLPRCIRARFDRPCNCCGCCPF